jgi:hypothetical protein
MRSIVKLVLVLLLPAQLFAQDTTVLKKQAQEVASAIIKKDYAKVVDHSYPKIVKTAGGKAKMLDMIKIGTAEMNSRQIVLESATVGSPGKFYKAGNEIHCLIPETVVLKWYNSSRIVNHANILAVSKDGGKFWYFLDINPNNYKLIPQIFPNFNKKLIIPEPTQPGLRK